MNIRSHVYVSGLVQGVSFRQNTRMQAKKLGVKGWVRNLPDGRVEAVFEGEQSAVLALVDFGRKGPEGAIVDKIEVEWEDFKNEFEDFKITY